MNINKSSVQRVLDELESLNLPTHFIELPQSTRTAKEAAEAVNCHVSQIVKSLVFQTSVTNKAVLILTSGSNQVDEVVVGSAVGEKIKFASVEFVRDMTGFANGGVSPLGLKEKITTFIDEDLLQHALIWAAAGSHHAVFSISPEDLVNATGAEVIAVH
ncbi:MAG: YbaK/EbsC family protein [Anaerolineales bacterium]|nr:YbaK/EbsC family protein [Anaerolineales bacterium]